MPVIAIRSDGNMVHADDIASKEQWQFVCQTCLNPVHHVRASIAGTAAHFRHDYWVPSCRLSHSHRPYDSHSLQTTVDTVSTKTAWHRQWQELGKQHCVDYYEAKGLGSAPNRPRDLGNTTTNQIIEFQHSPLSAAEFTLRNQGISHAVWIFDATEAKVFDYSKYAPETFFCQDTFRETYTSDSNCQVLFQCGDGKLYETQCDQSIFVEIGKDNEYVRLLKPVYENKCLDDFFGAGLWPMTKWEGQPTMKTAVILEEPIKVTSKAGRKEIDQIHRNFVCMFPSVPLTIVHAPPGAGKTTSLLKAIEAWQDKEVLVISFNNSVKDTMNKHLEDQGLHKRAKAVTLDSLCVTACKRQHFQGACSDMKFIENFLDKRDDKWWRYNHGGGKQSSAIVNYRMRHPNACIRVCSFHQKLSMKRYQDTNSKDEDEPQQRVIDERNCPWSADLNTYPIKQMCEANATYSACRLACDKGELLRNRLNSADVILVDEMQDLMSAQELRLLCQTDRPVVLVGDPMQCINSFRDKPPCDKCGFQAEPIGITLPVPIEWYGTYRLDAFTAQFIEERFNRPMFSCRLDSEKTTVHWQPSLLHPSDTLILCRGNASIVECMLKHPNAHVVKGKELEAQMRKARKDTTEVVPMAKFAQSLDEDEFERACRRLKSQSIELNELKGKTAITTVHQAKGFEWDHCAVHKDLLDPESEEERNISFVAFTRHRKSLVVLATLVGVSNSQHKKRKLHELSDESTDTSSAE